MATVFTEDYVNAQRRRWGHRDDREWPLVARIALDHDRSDDRDRIEGYVAALHRDDHEKLAANLRNEAQFIATYSELVVAQVLISAGAQPRYEQRIRTTTGYVTPDWVVSGDGGFICDVFTAGLLKERDAHETALREMVDRLGDGTLGCLIRIQMPNAAVSDAGDRKRIAAAVHAWIDSGPLPGSIRKFGPLTVELLSVGGDRVDVITVDPMHVVEKPSSISENLDEKVKRYGGLGPALLVAAVKHHRAETDASDIEDVLLGQLAYVSGVTASGRVVGSVKRLPGGVFQRRPNLSAVLYIEPHAYPHPTIFAWSNPLAATVFPEETLDRIAKTKL